MVADEGVTAMLERVTPDDELPPTGVMDFAGELLEVLLKHPANTKTTNNKIFCINYPDSKIH